MRSLSLGIRNRCRTRFAGFSTTKIQRGAAFAMPATCEPEGYTAARRKGNVRSLSSGARARFVIRVGYVDKEHAASAAARIEGNQR